MPIANFPTPTKSNFKKTEFINLSPGQHIIRILDGKAVMHNTHYVRGVTFKCLEDDCPVCKNNIRIRAENPNEKNPSTLPGYSSRRPIAYINVLDRTPAKICPNCQAEVKKTGGVFPPNCPKCNALITAVKALPLEKVKVLSKGKQFFDQVDFHEATTVDEETQTPLGLQNFDLGILVMGGKTTPAVSALPDRNDPIEVDEDSLYDLDRAIITLEPPEVLEVMRGVRLADIFAARKVGAEAQEKTHEVPVEMMQDMENLFNN